MNGLLQIVRVVLGVLAAVILGSSRLLASDSAADNSTPKRGGTLRIALPTDVTSLDPALAFDTISEPFPLLMFQGLVEYDDGTKVVPCLAKDWTISEGQRVYTFHLRPGVRFSNGREVAASDFVFTLEHLLDPKTAAPSEAWFEGIDGAKDFRAGKASHIRGLKAPQDDTLIIELERADPSFLYILTVPGALVVPREEVERYGKSFTMHPVGTGPYVLKQWRRSVKMRFERNPLFSHPERQYLDAVDVLVGGDPTTHLMMFERGELDIADVTEEPGIPVPDFVRIAHDPRWQGLIERIPAGMIWYLNLNTEMRPFDNLKVRQAVAYAVDKQKLVQLLHGMVTVANGVLPPTMPGFNPNLTSYPYDPAKARQLLAEAGYAEGFTCRIWYQLGNPLLIPPAYAIQFDLAQVGIKAQLNPLAMAPLVDSQERRHTVECCLTGWSQDYPDPSDFLDGCLNGNRISEEGCQNYAFYNNPKVNHLLDEAATCQDAPKRFGLYQDAEKIVVHDAPWVPLFYPYVYALHQPWLHGVRLHPVVYFRFERMWLDPSREKR
ncbi:MAG: ABC transporter substrate-binding protein [Limisphaerales bacterium]